MSGSLPPVAILTSGVGLGVYIPALLIESQLKSCGVNAEVEVLEGYYTPDRRSAHLAHKSAHHTDFALAKLANRMVRDVQDCFDEHAINALLRHWQEEKISRFIVWSDSGCPLSRDTVAYPECSCTLITAESMRTFPRRSGFSQTGSRRT
jgi:hypothetical protein